MLSLAQTIKQFRNNFKSLFSALGIVEREKSYVVNDVVFNFANNEIDFGWFLKCTQAGKTGTKDIAIPATAKNGDVITDGAVKWTLEAAIAEES